VAAIKIAYIGGGSTRAPGAISALMRQGENFSGSELVLIDLDREHLELVRALTQRMASARGVDLTVTATTNRREGMTDADAVFRMSASRSHMA
jgi:6-phospho-beta-glucosidase